MQKCFFSTYTKPDKMASIKNDMEYYNSMKRYAFSLIVKQGGDGPVPGGTSIHNHLKEKFNVNDHFANAAKNEASAAYRSAMECLQLNVETLESRIRQETKKLSSEQKRLDHLKKEKRFAHKQEQETEVRVKEKAEVQILPRRKRDRGQRRHFPGKERQEGHSL